MGGRAKRQAVIGSFWMLVVALGCGDKQAAEMEKAPATPADAQQAAQPADCPARTSDLATWMKALVDEGHRDSIAPAFRKDGTAVRLAAAQATERLPPRGPIITVQGGAVALNGRLAYRWPTKAPRVGASTASRDLGRLLASEWKTVCAQGLGDQTDLTLWIDDEAPWWVVRGVVQTAYQNDVDSLVLAFVRPSAVPAPGRSPIDADIERIEKKLANDTRLRSLNAPPDPDHPLEKAYRPCARAYDLLVLSQNTDFDDATHILTQEIPKAIAACDCNVDMTSVKALHWWWSGRRNPDALAAVGVRLPLAASGVKQLTPIAVRDDAPWSEAHAVVLAAREGWKAFTLVAAEVDVGKRATQAREPGGVCTSQPRGDDFASLTGTADFSSDLDDLDIHGGLIDKPAGVKPPPIATAKPDSPSIVGELDKAVIQKVVRRKMGAIRTCYERGLAKDPALSGTVTARFAISPEGKVISASTSGLANVETESCITRVIRSLVFPEPRGGGVVTVNYPIALQRSQ